MRKPMTTITLNGESYSCEPAMQTLCALVDGLALDQDKIAIERNQEVVPRSLWVETPIADGDQVEIIQFVGGG